MKPSSYYFGPTFDPTEMQLMLHPEALKYKLKCAQAFLIDLPANGAQTRAVSDAIEDLKILIAEVEGKSVQFYEPGEPRIYVPKNYLED